MKRISFTILILSLLIFTGEKSFASHGVGAEITYQSLGGNDYRFMLTFYRDCSGINVNPSYAITGTSSCGADFQFSVDSDSVANVSQTCDLASNKCITANSPNMGIQAFYYHKDVTLPFSCSDWAFGLNPVCNRNAAIMNLTPSGPSYCLYVVTTLNNASVAYNNSPTFTAQPLFHLCDQVQYVHMYAHDIDGDSLSFQMITPHSDANTDVMYIAGLSATQPVTFATAADSTVFDPTTGDIRFHADGQQVTVVAVQINEFRNGIQIGSVERDIEVIFNNCNTNISTSSGINGTSNRTAHICVDSLLTFQIHSADVDGDTTHISWQNSIPGSTLTVDSARAQSATFTWHPPDSSYISTTPYTFTISVTDSTCPYVYYNFYTFHIYVDSCYSITGLNDLESVLPAFSAHYSLLSKTILFNYQLRDVNASVVTLYDATGREIRKVPIDKSKEKANEIDVSGIAEGVYLLNLKTEAGVSRSIKVIVE